MSIEPSLARSDGALEPSPFLRRLQEFLLTLNDIISYLHFDPSWIEELSSWRVSVSTALDASDLTELFIKMLKFIKKEFLVPEWRDAAPVEASAGTGRDLIHLLFKFITSNPDIFPYSSEPCMNQLIVSLHVDLLNRAYFQCLQRARERERPSEFDTLRRCIIRLELGINWSGVFPSFRDSRTAWITKVGEATTVRDLIACWTEFEQVCNWTNLGPSFLPVQKQYRDQLAKCVTAQDLARSLLELNKYLAKERLSTTFNMGDRVKWENSLEMVLLDRVPSLLVLSCVAIVKGNLPVENLGVPQDLIETLEDVKLMAHLIERGASPLLKPPNMTITF